MKATPQEQGDLLELQRTELEVMRTNHQVRKHPLREKLAELAGRSDDLRRFSIGLRADIEDRRREIRRIEEEIQKVSNRGAVQQERLDQGKVPMRDMNAVEHEIVRINERKDELESQLLGQMEQLEAKEDALAGAERQSGDLAKDEAETERELADVLSEPNEKVAKLSGEVEELRDRIPVDVLEEYDRLKDRQGLPVVLELRDGNLVNSPVSISAGELGQVGRAPEDELWISGESGLLIARP